MLGRGALVAVGGLGNVASPSFTRAAYHSPQMSRLALATLLLLAAATPALANGRPPGTSTINFRQGHVNDVIAGMTFGAVISHDNGATWHYFCEDAIGYGGMYDPDYSYTSSGKIFATTFVGLKVNSTGCTFDDTSLGQRFVSSDELGPDGALYAGTADTSTTNADSDIYKSTDDGTTFPAMTMPGMINDWWESLTVAHSDAKRVYLTGYRFVTATGGGSTKVFLLFTSSDGGASWQPMQLDTMQTNVSSAIDIAGIDRTTPTTVYARVTIPDGIVGDALYRSTDAGQHWTKILEKGDSLNAFAVRANGDLVAGTPTLGASVSHDKGDTWTALVNPPHLGCLVENDAGELWGCTQNFGSMQVPGDNYGIMKTTDLATWTGVLRYQDILAPVDCPAGTVQYDKCTKVNWCVVKQQLGITSTAIECATAAGDQSAEATPMMGGGTKKGCCSTGQDAAPGAILLSVAIGFVTLRRRR